MNEEWEKYVGSDAWWNLKNEALKRAFHRCQHYDNRNKRECDEISNLEMHHISYPPGKDPTKDCVENVIIVCRRHHQDFTEGRAAYHVERVRKTNNAQ